MSSLISSPLIGIGLYTLAEAARLTQVGSSKIARWLRGHEAAGTRYDPLWKPQADLGEDGLFLGFRDLMEIRVAAAFIAHGLSPQKVRHAIVLARDLVGTDHPLATTAFRTGGRSVFFQVAREDGQEDLLDLFRQQYAFRHVVEQSLKDVDYGENGTPVLWWPLGKAKSVVVDPGRSFGQPIEAETFIPARTLARAATAEGSINKTARAWDVPVRAVKRAVNFERELSRRQAT